MRRTKTFIGKYATVTTGMIEDMVELGEKVKEKEKEEDKKEARNRREKWAKRSEGMCKNGASAAHREE